MSHRTSPARRRRGAAVRLAISSVAAITAVGLVPGTASAEVAPQTQEAAQTAAEQVLTWTAGDSMTEYTSAPTEATAGPATIVFETSLATGNTFGMAHTLTFDTSTPGYNHDVNLNIVASPFDAKGGRHEVEVTLSPGTYRYFCAIPGHGMMVGEFTVTGGGTEPGDTTAPEVSAQVAGEQDADGNFVGAATVTLNATDDSGVEAVEYSLDGGAWTAYTEPVAVTAPGAHTLRYRATDTAGNTSEPASVTFTVAEPPAEDTTAPEVSAEVAGERDADGNYVGAATVTLNATDASGVETVEYSLDDGAWTPYTEPVAVTAPGAHTLRYRATDTAGNTSAPASVTLTVAEPAPADTTAPEVSAHITGEKDADGNYVGAATVALHATDASGVETVEYSLDRGAWTPYTEPVAITTPGAHTLRYRATDTAGNTSEAAEVTVTVAAEQPEPDTTAPEVTVSLAGDRDGDGSFVGTATLTLAATDDSGVASIEYALDRGGWTSYAEPIRITAPGTHTVQYRATDTAGNTSAPASVTLTVVAPQPDDTTAPDVSVTVQGQKDGEAYVGTATVVLAATDASGVASIEYDLDGAGWAAYTGPVAVTEPGAHTLRYRATDTAGNASAPASVTFEVVDGEPGPGEPDACPDSDGLETVVIGGHDTTVANVDTGEGCTISDLIGADGEYRNHGKFVSHVAKVTGDLVERDIISAVEKGRIQSAAARSDIGK